MSRKGVLGAWSSATFTVLVSGAAHAQDGDRLLEPSIEQLGEIRVTSVSRREESNDAPANVYVITRRAGGLQARLGSLAGR